MALRRIIAECAKPLETLRAFDAVETAAAFGGLLTVPELQSNCIRLETLVHLALLCSRGQKKPQSKEISSWFSEVGEATPGHMEDPAEDIFVSNIATPRGNYRVLDGVWESGGFYLQRMINVIEGMPSGSNYDILRDDVYALLAISDAVCERAKLVRYQLGNENPEESLSSKIANSLSSLRRRIRFAPDDLRSLGVSLENLGDFIFDSSYRKKMLEESVGNSTLERFPLVARDNDLFLVLPTATGIAIRRYVIEKMISAGMRDALAAGLGREYASSIANIPLLGSRRGAPIEFQRTENGLIAGIGTTVDVGRHLNLVFFGETLNDIEKTGVAGLQPVSQGLVNDLDMWVDHFYSEALKDPNFRDGITLVVSCGIGRGAISLGDNKKRAHWRVEWLSASDLCEMSWIQDFKPLSLWRLFEAMDKVEASGVRLQNINGMLNMVAWARKLEGHLVPHSSLPDDFASTDAPLSIMIEQNALRGLRHEVTATWDVHVVQYVTGQWIRVRRDAESVFEEDRARPIYAGEEHMGNGLPGVYISSKRAWWVGIDAPEGGSGELAYRRWKMMLVWLARIVPVLETALPEFPAGAILWNAKFESANEQFDGDLNAVGFEEAKADINVNADVTNRIVSLTVGRKFDAATFNVENVAERAFVERTIEGFFQLAGRPFGGAEIGALTNLIVPDAAAREMHAFRVTQFRDYVRDSVPRTPILISIEDDAAFRFGLGWRVRKREEGGDIRGKSDCITFLNSLVRLIENELCEELRRYDRRTMLRFALRNHESAAMERDWWNRTSSAVLALRTDKEAAREAIANHDFKLSAAFQASRLLVELAICECPLDGGVRPGQLDFSRLMAKISFIYHVGGWSDAIRWDVMEPRVKIAPLGDILVNHDFIEEVMAPYGRAGSDVRLDDAVKSYARNLKEPDARPTVKGLLEEEFLDAWQDEFGLSLDEARRFLDALDDLGVKEKKAVFEVPKSRLLQIALDGKELPAASTAALVNAFIFASRSSWRKIPQGYEERDIHPWRFRRRLTTLRRPLVQLDEKEDPTIIVAPGIVREAFGYMVSGYHRGDFPARQLKSKMRAWAGKAANKQGKEFSANVSERLKELGWNTDRDVKITKLLRKGFERDYGDVDTLAWNANTGRVLIVECKDVQFRKTFGEIAEQLSDFRGEIRSDGKPDYLLRHLGRVKLITQHVPELMSYIGSREPLRIESHLVFKNPVPMQFALKRMAERVRIHTFDALERI